MSQDEGTMLVRVLGWLITKLSVFVVFFSPQLRL